MIETRDLPGDVVGYALELPALETGSARVLRYLLRASFSATYARAALGAQGGVWLTARLPRASLSPAAGESVPFALAALGHTLPKAAGQVDDEGLTAHGAERLVLASTGYAEQVQELRVNLEVAETAALLEETLTGQGLPCRPWAGTFRTELDLGEPGLRPLFLTVSVNRGGISFVSASGGPKPGGETKSLFQSEFELGIGVPEQPPPSAREHARMLGMLEFNGEDRVVKTALNRHGDVCLLCEVPSVFPGLVDHLVSEFLPLVRALRCSNGVPS